MLNYKLPAKVSLKKLIEAEEVLEGYIPSNRFSRLIDCVVTSEKPFDVSLKFGRNLSGKTEIAMKVEGSVVMQCQRCLEDFNVPIFVDTTLMVVSHDDEARANLKNHEPVIIENDILEVDLVVEDEILLVLPIVAKHPYEVNNKSCISGLVKSNFNIIDGHNDSIKRRSELGIENPFEKLKNTFIKK